MDRFEILITAEGFAVFDLEMQRILGDFESLQKARDFVQNLEQGHAA